MSHDRGCQCGRESYDYADCEMKECTRSMKYYVTQADKAPSLGALLSQTLNELEQAKIKGLEAQANADLEKIRKERADLTQFVNKIADDITESITAGKVPMIKVSDYDLCTWVKKSNDPRRSSVEHRDIWDGLLAWANMNGLNITVTDGWGAASQKSWVNISAKPKAYRL
jgi:hypothetical protein